MKIKLKASSIILSMILVFLSGCQNRSEQIYQLYTSNPDNILPNASLPTTETSGSDDKEAIDETPGELTICVPYSSWELHYSWKIAAFNKQYPNIKVTVNCLNGEYTAVSDAEAKVSVELMSGTAGDVMDLSGMPATRYGENNLLEDLNTYMENDPDIHTEDYYTNVFEAMEFKNKLYAMPMDFFYFCVRFNKPLLEKYQIEAPEGNSINYQQILDIYYKIAPSNNKLILSHYWDPFILEGDEIIGYIDEKKKITDFNSSGFMEFLNEMKNMTWPSAEEMDLAWQDNYHISEEFGGPAENDLCFFVGSYYQDKRNARCFYDFQNLTPPIPMSATNGDKGMINSNHLFGIISSSKNKDLAWKFIKFCIEEKPVEFLTNTDGDNVDWIVAGMPINRNNTLKMLEAAFEGGDQEAVQMIDRWNSERNEVSDLLTDHVLLEAKYSIEQDFYSGRISAEECAKQLQERVDIYLKE